MARYSERGKRRRPWTMNTTVPFTPRGPSDWFGGQAAAPIIPPDLRPANLHDHVLVWEAEWTNLRAARPPMSFDPALLEHVVGSLYCVTHVWDLTEVEIAALR